MVVPLIVAADLAWLRWFLIGGRRSLFGLQPMALDLGIVPTLSVLAMVGHLIASRRGRGRPFLVGAAISGSVALIAYAARCLTMPETIDHSLRSISPAFSGWSGAGPFRRFLAPLGDAIFLNAGPFDLWEITWVAALLCLPQALIALAGGLLASWLRRPGARGGKADPSQDVAEPS